jgi:hypothetical protein
MRKRGSSLIPTFEEWKAQETDFIVNEGEEEKRKIEDEEDTDKLMNKLRKKHKNMCCKNRRNA